MLPVKRNLLPTVSRFFDDDWYSLFDWSNNNYSAHSTTLPSVNIQETGEEFIVEMAAPGMRKDDFQIELRNSILTITSKKQMSNEQKGDNNYLRKEFSYQEFQRSFNLNNRVVDDANIKATYKDGILSLTLPKKEEAKEKPARLIKVS